MELRQGHAGKISRGNLFIFKDTPDMRLKGQNVQRQPLNNADRLVSELFDLPWHTDTHFLLMNFIP